MPLDFNKRLSALEAHFNDGVSVQSIARLTGTTVDEIQELCDIAQDYLGDEKLPRRRPKREETAAAPAAPKTRARTASTAGETKTSTDEGRTRAMSAAEAENRTVITPPTPRGNDAEREGFNPGAAA